VNKRNTGPQLLLPPPFAGTGNLLPIFDSQSLFFFLADGLKKSASSHF
jgi:hypothetical protein